MCYQKLASDGHLSCFVGKEPDETGKKLWHLSISHRSNTLVDLYGHPLPGRIPTWDEIKEARYLFVPDEVCMAMMLPPKRLYVNVHPTRMHLWEIPMENCR
jgi:hypothetical protein